MVKWKYSRLLVWFFCLYLLIGLFSPMIARGQTFTEFTLPTTNSGPYGITTGPDGNLWFTEFDGNRIGRLALSQSTASLVPTMTEWGMMIFMVLAGIWSIYYLKRLKRVWREIKYAISKKGWRAEPTLFYFFHDMKNTTS